MNQIQQIWVIALKELKSYFVSPIAYIVTAMFLLISGYFFTLILQITKDASMMSYLFGNIFYCCLKPFLNLNH